MKLSKKQLLALNKLTDDTIVEVGYGGGAGGGKTILGCFWLMLMCSELKGSRWFIGRDSLKDTRESVLFTWRKVAKMLNIATWRYNDNHIFFGNGSEIVFLDLSYMPNKDPMYERFGSLEFTGGWIEEAGPVHPQAREVLKTRINRWYNKEYEVKGKLLITFNPKKNWLYHTFYLPYKNNTLDTETTFIPALYHDNPYLEDDYITILKKIKDKVTRERLLHGNFEYDDDPSALLTFDQISNIWYNDHIHVPLKWYLTADIARFGSDDAIIIVWQGFKIIEYHKISLSKTTLIQKIITTLRKKWKIPVSRAIGDEDGVGGGVIDNTGITGFVNNSKSPDKGYYNLKSLCGYLIPEFIDKIWFAADIADSEKERIESELGQLKTYETDKDGKLRLLPKAKIKEQLGYSPDWLDNFIMRMYFEIYNSDALDNTYQKARQLLT